MPNDIRYGFIPPGHRAIMGIPVVHAWPHSSGAWLSIQPVGRSMALVWRSSDSWKATSTLVHEVDSYPTREENFDAAFRIGVFLVDEGPPPALLASAAKSAQSRKEKASTAAQQRWKNHSGGKKHETTTKPEKSRADLVKGPNVDARAWKWENYSYDPTGEDAGWMLLERGDEDTFLACEWVSEDRWRLVRTWRLAPSKEEVIIQVGTLEECFAVMESMAKRGSKSWQPGETS